MDSIPFSEVDAEAQEGQTSEERAQSDYHRADIGARLRLGIAIRDAREEAGLSQAELGLRSGTSEFSLSRIEAGHWPFPFSALVQIVYALDVDFVIQIGSHRAVCWGK